MPHIWGKDRKGGDWSAVSGPLVKHRAKQEKATRMFQGHTGDEKDMKYILDKAVGMGRAGIKSRVQNGRRPPAYFGHPLLRTVSLWPIKV